MMALTASSFLLTLLLAISWVNGQQTGVHTDEPRWCGKVYESGYASFNPGGQTVQPKPVANGPLLYVQVAPRYSLYLDSESHGEFVVRTALSPYFGGPLPAFANGSIARLTGDELHDLHFTIALQNTSQVLASGTAKFGAGKKQDTLVPFNLTGGGPLKAGLAAQNVTLKGWVASPDGHGTNATYMATTELFYLPDKIMGSVTRLDNVNGGFFFRNASAPHSQFEPFFPYGFYASYDGFLANVSDSASATSVIGRYAGFGLNAMTPLTQYPQSAAAFAYMEVTDLRFQFDLREQYTNLTWVAQQVAAAHTNAALFSYWSADEPDGHQDPFSAPINARDTIRSIDPYHPVAVVLNCQDYYFGPYTQGADVIMEDVYPIGINSTFSKWSTACNATLGDCGCDNCRGGPHAVQDVGDRLDDLARYEAWLGRWPKTKVHNPQSFHGEGYWSRDPTPQEEWAMALLAVNHGAQAIISWVYPASDLLAAAHGRLAKVLASSPVLDFVVGGDRPHAVPAPQATPNIDVAYWQNNTSGGGSGSGNHDILVSVVNSGYDVYAGPVTIPIPIVPEGAVQRRIGGVPWGNLTWTWADGKLVSTGKVPALATSLVLLTTA